MVNRDRLKQQTQPKLRILSVKICYKVTQDDQYQLAFSFVSEIQGQLDRNYLTP
jgi:hypothetical protein